MFHQKDFVNIYFCMMCHTLGVITGGCANDPVGRNVRREHGDLVVRTAQLEGKDWLQILALQQHLVGQTP
jgi:hypothetical protein